MRASAKPPASRSVQPLGLDFDPRQLVWTEAERHEVAGNHMRFDQTSELVLDEEKGASRRSSNAPSIL